MDACVLKVYEALKDKTGRPRVRMETIESWHKDITKRPTYDPGELEKKLIHQGRTRIHEASVRRRQAAIQARARTETLSYILRNFEDNPQKGILAFLGGVQSGQKGSRLSVYSAQQSLSGKYVAQLYVKIFKAGLLSDVRSGELDDLIAREIADLASEKPTGKATSSSAAKQVAKIVYDAQEYARKRANKAGADIGKLDGYFMGQTHDQFRIRKVDRDEWVDFVYSRLDKERTFGRADIPDAEAKKILQALYAEFAAGSHRRLDSSPPALAERNRGANVGGSLSSERFLHFRGVDEQLEYSKAFGRADNMIANIVHNLDRLGKKTALMERAGVNPTDTIDYLYRALEDRYKNGTYDQKKLDKIVASRTGVMNLLAEVDGSTSIPGNAIVAKYGQVWRQIQSTAKLGGAVISAMVDPAVAASELRHQGFGALSAYHHSIIGGFNDIPRARKKELASFLAVWSESASHSMTERFGGFNDIDTVSGISGAMSRTTNAFFKLSGLTDWTDRMKINVSLAMSARIGAASNQKWSGLEDDLKRVLEMFDLGEKEWGVLSKAVDTEGDHRFVTPEAVERLDDSVFKELYPNRNADDMRDEISGKLRSYFIDRTEHAVIMPDARTRAWLKQGSKPGTVLGEALRCVTQFKAYPVSYIQKVGGRSIHGKGGLDASGVAEIAHIIVSTTLLGYLAMSAKDALKGRTPRDPFAPSTILAAMAQGGAAGIYGDFILGTSNRFGGSFVETLAGPTAGTVGGIVGLGQSMRDALMGLEDAPDVGPQALKLIQGNTPFANLFYVKPVIDYLIVYQLGEMMNPGYLQRMEQRTEEQNRQKFMEFARPSNIVQYGGGF